MSQVEAIKARREEYTGLLDVLETKPTEVAPNGTVVVYLGDGYFTEMDLEPAKKFVRVRLETLKTQHEGLLYSQGITEEGLPIMDIYEELDEEGNVIKSSVERTGGSMDKIKQALNGIYKEHEARVNGETRDTEPRIRELYTQPTEPPEPSESPEPSGTEADADAEAEPTFHGINRDDMIELELLSDEIGDMQVKMDEDEQLDDFDDEYEFEYDEDASEESDEDEFGRTKGSLFPTDPRTARLLEQHLTKKRADSKKSVSFSPSLEIKEFETTSAERKGQIHDPEVATVSVPDIQEHEEPKSKVSLFKQRMGPSHSRESKLEPISEKPAVGDIVEKPSMASLQKSAAIEKPVAKITEKQSATPHKSSFYSRKYAPANRSIPPKPLNVPETEDSTIPPEFVQHTNDPQELDLQQLEPDALKYFEDATIPDEDFLALHNTEDTQLVLSSSCTEDSPVTSGIVERMPEFKGVDEEVSDMKQMRNEYQRLRQKLVYKAGGYKKTEKDQATDDVDEDGNPIKVSRFKSARMGLR